MEDKQELEAADPTPVGAMTAEQVAEMIHTLGVQRYSRSVRKAAEKGQQTTTAPGRLLLSSAIGKMIEALQGWMRHARGTPGPKHLSVRHLEAVDLNVVAFITAQIVLDKITQRAGYLTVAHAIAVAIEDEARFAQVQKALPMEWRKITRRIKSVNLAHRRKVIRGQIAKLAESWEAWPRKERYQLGTVLIELFAASTGLIEVCNVPKMRDGKVIGKTSTVKATPAALEWMAQSHDEHRARFPFYLPLVCPPEPWTTPVDGGYPANIFMRWPLVRGAHKRAAAAFDREAMPEVYDAVNALQATPWRINDNVFAVLDYFWKNKIAVADVPSQELRPIPNKPEDIATNAKAKKDWKRSAAAAHSANARLGAQLLLVSKLHFIARHYQHQEFWFPYKLDFRGRAYPIPAFLNPQGCPLAKGLLHFAEGRPINTRHAEEWWLIHGANTWGLDKKPFAERIKWVGENEVMILGIAEDPLGNRQWEDADSPWQFLAFCFEYASRKEDGHGFVSRLPIAMDGTNNGLQIYSLLLRDPAGAAATNVTAPPGIEDSGPYDAGPRDIYQDVADSVTAKLRTAAEQGPYTTEFNPEAKAEPELARNWLLFTNGRLPRAATKRPVMVLPYGGTKFSCREYVEDWYEEEVRKRGLEEARPFPTTFTHTRYLTALILDSIREIVAGAVQAMDWLRKVADVCTKIGAPLIWRTPSGFRVYQRVSSLHGISIKTRIGRVVRHRRAKVPGSKMSKRGQANGLPPNFVHSLDASILVKTVQRAASEGVTAFSMVHDSFATHAENAAKLARIIREVCAEMFSVDLLTNFAAQIASYLPPGTELPAPPALGGLDPRGVQDSPYFFA